MSENSTATVRYFAPPHIELNFERPPQDRLPIAILTSVRDLVSEQVGTTLRVQNEKLYVRGTIERTIDELRSGGLARYVELRAIITDDMPRDVEKRGFPVMPTKGMPWIHPLSLRIDGRTQARDLYFNVPSKFRDLPLEDTQGRAETKQHFEERIHSLMRQTGAEVLVADHFLCKIEYLIRCDFFNLFGRVLNTHPGITHNKHPFATRGPNPYMDAIYHAKGIHYDRATRTRTRLSGSHPVVGSSFHVIDQGFDTGTVLCDAEATPVYQGDTWRRVAARNYAYSKPVVFQQGLKHYAAHIYPHISQITSWDDLQEVEREEPLCA